MPDRAPPPDDLPALKRWLAARPDASDLQPIGIQEIVVRSDALLGLSELLADLDAPARVLLVLDETFYRRGSDSLKPLVHEVLSGHNRSVEPCVLAVASDGLVHADMEQVEQLRARIGARPAAVVALGSGSVCDVAKHACYLAEREDGAATTLVLVPTAVSVTAFTSSLSVLLVDGVKRTRSSRFPDAVVCDLQTLMDAPPSMLRAGLGDCCARFVSYGDWYLAHQLGLVDRYSETPLALMGEDLDALYLEQAEAIGAGRADGILFLTRQVLLAGLAQSVVNLSAPLSGTEHVVSHVLDMGAAAWGRPLALHGAQVGVATTIAARAYELLLARFEPFCPRPTPPSPESAEAAIRTAFLPLDPSGQMADECWRDYGRKLARWTEQEAAFDAVRERWTTVVAPRLRQLVRPSETIRAILARAGHPLTFAELEPPIPLDQAGFALANAHLIRERFTVGDLFTFLDLGGEGLVEELLGRSSADDEASAL